MVIEKKSDRILCKKLKFLINKDQKDKVSFEHQREIDDLQLKLANLDLKHKQLMLEDNREAHAIKVKLLKKLFMA